MTINEFKVQAIKLLSSICENPQFEAEQLLQFALGIQKNDLLLKRNDKLSTENESSLNALIERRLAREPLQYICGEWDFLGLRMFCGKGCLIPRPETEMIAEYAIKHLPQGGHLLDLCTGSGCISVSILKNRSDVTATAIDISNEALFYAKKNAQYHWVSSDRLEFICKDMREFSPEICPDIIVSNPPYIKSADIPGLSPEVQHEPHIALDGGSDGLEFYKVIANNYSKYLKENGQIVMEIGYDIAEDVENVFIENNFKTTIVSDVFGNKRMCVATKS